MIHIFKFKINLVPGLKHVGVGDGSDFLVTIQSGGQKQLETLFIDESNCQQKYNKV